MHEAGREVGWVDGHAGRTTGSGKSPNRTMMPEEASSWCMS